jgi:hypothetical protein
MDPKPSVAASLVRAFCDGDVVPPVPRHLKHISMGECCPYGVGSDEPCTVQRIDSVLVKNQILQLLEELEIVIARRPTLKSF